MPEADHSAVFSAEVTYLCSCNHASCVCLYCVHSDNFNFCHYFRRVTSMSPAECAVQNCPLHCWLYFIYRCRGRENNHNLSFLTNYIFIKNALNPSPCTAIIWYLYWSSYLTYFFFRLYTPTYGNLRVGDFFVLLLEDSVLHVVLYTLIHTLACGKQCYIIIIIFFIDNFTGEYWYSHSRKSWECRGRGLH